MKTPICTSLRLRAMAERGLVIVGLAALLHVSTANAAAPGALLQSLFVPMEPEKNLPEGSFGQTDAGGFVCYGTVKPLPRLTGLVNLEYGCEGKTATLAEHVSTHTGGTYLGATFLYKNPALVGHRGVYTVGGARPGISGVLVYYR